MTYVSHNANQTKLIAENIAKTANPGDIFCLSGDLGAGKTVFAKGFAHGLGVTEDVVSPTFCILNEYYTGCLPLYHFDVYRIHDGNELDDICFPDYLNGVGVCLIEWAENINERLPETSVWICIRKTDEDNTREIIIAEGRQEA